MLCQFTEKDIDMPKGSCVLNCCSGFPCVFFPGTEINFEEDVNLPFILFHTYRNVIFFLFSQTNITLVCQNMSFVHKYRKCQERKSYITEKSRTEIM